MPVYKYQARDQLGNLITGQAEAEDLQVLKTGLKERGIWLTKAQKANNLLAKVSFHPGQTVKPLEILMFSKQMGVMLGAGVSLVTALSQILSNASTRFRPVVIKIIEDVKNGKAYAEALAAYPGIFSPFFVGMIEVGEAGGMLAEMHRKLTAHLQQAMNLKKKLMFASIYPAFVLLATVAGIAIILIHAFPKIADIYSKHQVELPLITRAMLALSGFLIQQWYIPVFLTGLLLFLVLGLKIQQKPPLKPWLDRLSLKIPVYNEFISQIILARLTLNLSLLLNSGVSILRALGIVKILVQNTLVQTYIDELSRSVQEGEGMATYLQTNPFFPSLLVSLVQTGETSGELVKMMDEASEYFSVEVEEGMKKFVAVIEPALIVFAAGAVFLVLLAFYLPMFQMFKVLNPQ
ncbi:MAG TPA: type II secretion system F family protein [Bacillota bacterium]|nr:type II secretion system F family protein [Bacillota bacterium]